MNDLAIVMPCLLIGVLVVWASLCGRLHRACLPQCRCGEVGQFKTRRGWMCPSCYAVMGERMSNTQEDGK